MYIKSVLRDSISRVLFLVVFFLSLSPNAYALAKMAPRDKTSMFYWREYTVTTFSLCLLLAVLARLKVVISPSREYGELTNALESVTSIEEISSVLEKRALFQTETKQRRRYDGISARVSGLVIIYFNCFGGIVGGCVGLLCLCLLQLGDRVRPFLYGAVIPSVLFSMKLNYFRFYELSFFVCILCLPVILYLVGQYIEDHLIRLIRKFFQKDKYSMSQIFDAGYNSETKKPETHAR